MRKKLEARYLKNLWAILLAFGWVGCGGGGSAPVEDAAVTVESAGPTWSEEDGFDRPDAQARLPTITLYVGAENLEAEIARSQLQIASGMMHRESIGEDEGMLFVMDSERLVSFYMRNTIVPLSCAYIGTDGRIKEIHDLEPLDEESVPSKTSDIRFVLEVKQGWFEERGIGVGTLITSERGELARTFFGGLAP